MSALAQRLLAIDPYHPDAAAVKQASEGSLPSIPQPRVPERVSLPQPPLLWPAPTRVPAPSQPNPYMRSLQAFPPPNTPHDNSLPLNACAELAPSTNRVLVGCRSLTELLQGLQLVMACFSARPQGKSLVLSHKRRRRTLATQ